jgi:hypothetical protein
MLRKSFLGCGLVTAWAIAALAQAPAGELDRVRELVAAGAAPRSALERAQAEVDDRQDEATLRRTLYGMIAIEEINAEDTAAMIAAAGRRVQRKRARLAEMESMAAEGLVARAALAELRDEIRDRETTLELARNRAALLDGISAMARREMETAQVEETQPEMLPVRERFDGNGQFTREHLRKVVLAFEKEFGKALPVSAHGDTAFHRAMGFDHRGRVDVALTPDQPEGVWLRRFLEQESIPYYAFRSFVPGAATGAHIHIGPPSLRLRVAD